jgi:uncharacterized protein YkwD
MRARRPLLPALTAVLAGALVAGAGTLLSGPAAESSADQNRLSVEVTSDKRPSPSGGQAQPSSSATSTSSSTPAGESSTPPPSTSVPVPATTTPPAPTTTAAPPPVTTTPPDPSTQAQVVGLVNAARQDAGCDPLTSDTSLATAAQRHAADMASRDYFEHTTPEGVTFDQRIRNAGYSRPGAENIAKGARTADSVMELWMNSPGHRANILDCDLNTIGVGLDRDGFYWVQDFGF